VATYYYKRFIDDIFGIWIGNTTNEWSSFCDDINNFGVLTWDIGDNKPSLSVDFLDLTIMIRGSKIVLGMMMMSARELLK